MPSPSPHAHATHARISSRLVLHLVTLLPYFPFPAYARRKEAYLHTYPCISISIPIPSPPNTSACCVCHHPDPGTLQPSLPFEPLCSQTLTPPYRVVGCTYTLSDRPLHCLLPLPSQTQRSSPVLLLLPSLCSRHPSRAPSSTSTQWPTRNTNPPSRHRRL